MRIDLMKGIDLIKWRNFGRVVEIIMDIIWSSKKCFLRVRLLDWVRII